MSTRLASSVARVHEALRGGLRGRGLGRGPERPRDGSQHGEVTMLRALIGEDWPRVLVDVGAYDGITLSNSRPFILEGWRALLVEPQPGPFTRAADLYRDHANVVCLNKACADSSGRLALWVGSDGADSMAATLCTDDNEWFREHRPGTSIRVEVDTLSSMLDAFGCPADFSLLLVDAEGMDHEVLSGLDFSRHRPRVVLTEEYRWNPEKHEQKYELLRRQGYALQATIGCNTLWALNTRS